MIAVVKKDHMFLDDDQILQRWFTQREAIERFKVQSPQVEERQLDMALYQALGAPTKDQASIQFLPLNSSSITNFLI